MTTSNASAKMQKFAEDYGYQLSFFQSNPELYGVFQKALSGNWDSVKFTAALRNTGWYKTHGEAYRTNDEQRFTDPGTWNQKVATQKASMMALAGTLGINFSTANLNKITEDSLLFGWNDAQTRDVMSKYIRATAGAGGVAGQVRQALSQTAYRNGIKISQGYLDGQAQSVAAGKISVQDAQQNLRSIYAKSLAPAYAKQIDSGMDLWDIASPYMQSMAQTLELNPSNIDLFDPTIRKALSSATPDAKSGEPTSTPMWQFENQLRQDPRWLQTKNGQDQMMSTTHNVLQSFGLGV